MTALDWFALGIVAVGVLVLVGGGRDLIEGWVFVVCGMALELVAVAIRRGWLFLLLLSLVGCGNPFSGPSCVRTVVEEVKQDTQVWVQAEGRWVLVDAKIWAPGGVREVCEETK